MRRALAIWTLLAAFLLCLAGSASAYVDYSSKNRVGNFGDSFAPQVGLTDPLFLEPHQENTIAVYDPATGVLFYVRQNPWSKFDPFGLWEGSVPTTQSNAEEVQERIDEQENQIDDLEAKRDEIKKIRDPHQRRLAFNKNGKEIASARNVIEYNKELLAVYDHFKLVTGNGADYPGEGTIIGGRLKNLRAFMSESGFGKIDDGLINGLPNPAIHDVSLELAELGSGVGLLRGGVRAALSKFGRGNGNATASTLHTRGLKPAAGTRARPEGIPADWKVRPTKSGGGVQYYNPKNPNQNVRVMQGNSNSPYPNSQGPYVRQQNAGGTYLRQDGTPSPLRKGGLHDGDAHIPLNQFQFR